MSRTCPFCGDTNVQSHSLTAWCLRCGWAKNTYPDPATGRPTENRPPVNLSRVSRGGRP